MNCDFSSIYELGFVTYDLMLYLDTHPDDKDALNAYYDYANEYKKCVKEYEENYSPLTALASSSSNYFDWVNSPWPWEVNDNCGCKGGM